MHVKCKWSEYRIVQRIPMVKWVQWLHYGIEWYSEYIMAQCVYSEYIMVQCDTFEYIVQCGTVNTLWYSVEQRIYYGTVWYSEHIRVQCGSANTLWYSWVQNYSDSTSMVQSGTKVWWQYKYCTDWYKSMVTVQVWYRLVQFAANVWFNGWGMVKYLLGQQR
jgi:hypothetical protein